MLIHLLTPAYYGAFIVEAGLNTGKYRGKSNYVGGSVQCMRIQQALFFIQQMIIDQNWRKKQQRSICSRTAK